MPLSLRERLGDEAGELIGLFVPTGRYWRAAELDRLFREYQSAYWRAYAEGLDRKIMREVSDGRDVGVHTEGVDSVTGDGRESAC